MQRLNLGCGTNKIPGYVNIDIEESVKPDVVHDFTKGPLPYEDNTVIEILLFHTIEHISKRFHRAIFGEFWRVLKPGGTLIVSFPEFIKCYSNWLHNTNDQKEFWEATLFGRQLYPSDFHVCAMDSHDFGIFLKGCGFVNVVAKPEPVETYNSFVVAEKGPQIVSNTELLNTDNFVLTPMETK